MPKTSVTRCEEGLIDLGALRNIMTHVPPIKKINILWVPAHYPVKIRGSGYVQHAVRGVLGPEGCGDAVDLEW